MSRVKNVAVVGLALAAGAGLIFWRQGSFRAPFARAASSNTNISAEVETLRAEVAALRTRAERAPVVVRYGADAGHSNEALTAAAVPPALTREEKAERIERHAQAVVDALDQRLVSEGRDPVWSNESLAHIDESIKSRVPGAALVESTCSTNVCRVVLRHDRPEQQRGLGGVIADAPPFDQGTLYRYDNTTEPPETTLYVIRSGHDLPELTGLQPPEVSGG
jgi:hypothetical protein